MNDRYDAGEGPLFGEKTVLGLPADLRVKNFRLELSAAEANEIGDAKKENVFYHEINEFLSEHTVYDIDVNESLSMTGSGISRRQLLVKDVHVYYRGEEG